MQALKRSRKRNNPFRIKFQDRYDYVNQRYFFWTYFYALFYLIGSSIGYRKTSNLYCLWTGVAVGIVLFLLAIGHTIDYYRGVPLEALYVSVPFSKCRQSHSPH
jgi:hypothetical protein